MRFLFSKEQIQWFIILVEQEISHYVAEVLSKSLQDTMQSIESAQGIKQDEMIGIVTPVYFFGLPDIVRIS